jgi:hypothetical protein
VATAAFLLAIVSTATAKYSGGSGTAQDPYQIATAADLIALGETPADYDKHFILTADIDLDPNLPGRKVFDKALIAPDTDPNDYYCAFQGTPFTGVFDGNGHRILHLTITGKHYLGLFGQLGSGAQVKNLGLVDVNITGSGAFAGGLVGNNGDSEAGGGAVSRCYSAGSVSGLGLFGGLVGNNYGTVNQCYSTGAVGGGSVVGGLVGQNAGTVTHCYSAGAVSGTGGYVGGMVGDNAGYNVWGPGRISNSYSTGAVNATGDCVGGLVGNNNGEGSGTVLISFWDMNTSGWQKSAGGTGKTTAEMQDIHTYQDAGWDFVGEPQDGLYEFWQMPQTGGYPVLAVFNGYTPPQLQGLGTPEDPYLVSDAMELGAMIHYGPSAHYRLVDSIDLSDVRWSTAVIPLFTGTFDGNGLTISHLTIKGKDYVGLIGCLASGAEVKDLGVVDVNITGSGDYVGGLVGSNGYGDGGGTITNCYASGLVTGNHGVGGLVGRNSGAVTRCCSTGVVSGSQHVGGLVGDSTRYNEYGSISNSCSTGWVSGSENVGGLVGNNTGIIITNCYSTGSVSGSELVGGLVGASYYGTITNCYSTGNVSGDRYVGGLLAGYSAYAALRASFWDIQASGQSASITGIGKTTAEMQTAKTFLDAGWDFVGETANGTEDIWWILEGKDYPRLWWQAAKK